MIINIYNNIRMYVKWIDYFIRSMATHFWDWCFCHFLEHLWMSSMFGWGFRPNIKLMQCFHICSNNLELTIQSLDFNPNLIINFTGNQYLYPSMTNWCALQIKVRSFSLQNSFVTLAPNKYPAPLEFTAQYSTSSGSDHIRSQKAPSWGISTFFIFENFTFLSIVLV